jgi:opacity protein-like surface antigen
MHWAKQCVSSKYDKQGQKVRAMKKIILVLFLTLFVINAHAEEFTGNVNFLLGQKSLKSEDWEPLEDQLAFAVLVDFKQDHWPVSIALDFLGSYDEQTIASIKFEGMTSEFDAGVRKIWEFSEGQIKPYIGGGIAFVNAEIKATDFVTVSDDDNAVGYWLNGGIYWTLNQHFNLGFDLRYSDAKVTLVGFDVEAGGTTAGIFIGYHW